MDGINVLSLFDGMSCGQIALKELGITVNNYFASEIDKHAIAQTQYNFPNTVQLGDVTTVKAKDLPPIDLLIGGSPCQGFSFAGKQLNFNDPRSVLFFEYVRILKELREINPNVKFLLENVRMKKESEAVISKALGVFPVVINSALVSAQNRVRLYWSDIQVKKVGLFGETYSDIEPPADKGIFLRDIIDKEVAEKYYINRDITDRMLRNLKSQDSRANCLLATAYKGSQTNGMTLVEVDYCAAMRGRPDKSGKNVQRLEPREDNKTNCLTSVEKDNFIVSKGKRIRRLTPLECSRLQTIPVWYKWNCSDTQAYKMLGNGWTVDVIAHILKGLLNN